MKPAIATAVLIAVAGTSACTSSAADPGEVQRAVAAAFPDCSQWQEPPEGAVLVPGVETEWALGCDSGAAVIALTDPPQLCDYWDRIGDGPDAFATTMDASVVVLDLNGRDQQGAQQLTTMNPEMFAMATPETYCSPEGWEPPTSQDLTEAQGIFAEACSAWAAATSLPASDDIAIASLRKAGGLVNDALLLAPGNATYERLDNAFSEYAAQTVLISEGSPIADVEKWNTAVSDGAAACGWTVDEMAAVGRTATASDKPAAAKPSASSAAASRPTEVGCEDSLSGYLETAQIVKLAECPQPEARAEMAARSAAPLDVVRALAVDPDPLVRRAIAGRDNLSSDLITTLVADPDSSVRAKLFMSHFRDLTKAQTARLLADESEEVRTAVARRSYRLTPKQQLALANDESPKVVSALISDLGSFIEDLSPRESKTEREALDRACSRSVKLDASAKRFCGL